MKLVAERIIVFLLFSATAYSQFTKTSTDRADDIAAIRQAISEVERSFVSRETSAIEKTYIDGYVGIKGKIVYNARDQLLAMIRWDAAAIKAGKKLDFETLSYESDIPLVTVYDDAAIVTSLKKNLWRYKDDKCLSKYQSTELWIKVGLEWKVAVGHMSAIPCDPLPWLPPHPAVVEARTVTRPSKYLSPSAETELRELISKLNEGGTLRDSGSDMFTADFTSTGTNNDLNSDRTSLLAALRTPTGRGSERYKDDEAFLSYGNSAAYFFRVRSIARAGESKPEPPVTFSVYFVKQLGSWKIAASHASSLQD